MDPISTTTMMGAAGAGGDSYWWAKFGATTAASFSFNDPPNKLAVDSSGNTSFTTAAYITSLASNEMVLGQYDTDGTLQWQRTLGSTSSTDTGTSAVINPQGGIVFVGQTNAGPGYNTDLYTEYSSSGSITFQKQISLSSSNFYMNSVAAQSTGFIYTTGIGLDTAINGSNYNVILRKLYAGGTQWKRMIYISGYSHNTGGVELDSNGHAYVGFRTSFNSGSAGVVKVNNVGTLQWAKVLSGIAGYARAVTVDSSGNVYMAGNTNSGPFGANDIFVVKYNTNGVLLWQRVIGGSATDYPTGIALDSLGNIYISGYTDSAGTTYRAGLVMKLNSSGVTQWQRIWYPTGSAPATNLWLYGIAVDSNDDLRLIGVASYSPQSAVLIFKIPSDGSLFGTHGDLQYEGTGSIQNQASSFTDIAITGSTSCVNYTETNSFASLTDSALSVPSSTTFL